MNQATQTTEKTGRYQVGESVYGISFILINRLGVRESRKSFFTCINNHPVLTDFRFLEFKVKEHHKVAWDQDPKQELQHDGYILEAVDGRKFHNQYPTASYGQVSDIGDRIFRLDLREYDADAREALFKNEGEVPTSWINVTEPLDELYRGVHDAAFQLSNELLHNKYVALLDTIVREFEKSYPGKTIDFIAPWAEAPSVKQATVVDKL